jgi:hypothetical protein
VWKAAVAALVVCCPQVYDVFFQAAESLVLRDAGIGYAVHATVQQGAFLGGREVAVVRHALVVVVRYEVHHVFFQVGTGAADDVHLSLADHLSKAFYRARRCSWHPLSEISIFLPLFLWTL